MGAWASMIQIFVDTECGTVSDHFEFAAAPRMGEVVFIQTESVEIKLRVNLVEHYPPAKGDVMDRLSAVTIQCEVVQ